MKIAVTAPVSESRKAYNGARLFIVQKPGDPYFLATSEVFDLKPTSEQFGIP
jgi:hypothetical protein